MGASAGRVLLIPKGDWNANTTYTGLDWVRHNGAAWVCKNTCTNIEPTPANTNYWQLISKDGDSVTADTAMSDSSTNAVQNKVIKRYVDNSIAGIADMMDTAMSSTSANPVQNKVIKRYVDNSIAGIADMTGATATLNGERGLVPAPKIGDEKKALLGDGTWGKVDAIFTYSTKSEYDTAVANNEIPDGATVIKDYDD